MADNVNNVRSLDEWRAQQRSKHPNEIRAPWMRRQRPRARQAMRSGTRGALGRPGHGFPYGYRNPLGQRNAPGQRPASYRSGGLLRHSGPFGASAAVSHVRNAANDWRTPHGRTLHSVTGSTAGRGKLSARTLLAAFALLVGTVVIGAFLLWSGGRSVQAEPEPLPPLLRLWAAVAEEHEDTLLSIVVEFEQEHGVRIELYNTVPPTYELVRTLMSGSGPDVMFVDADTSTRLLAMDALHPLRTSVDAAPDELDVDSYILRLAEESLWVRSLRAVIPLHVRDAALAQQFVAYVADF